MKSKTQVVSETNIGMYVWEMPDGSWVGDDDGHFMNIVSMRNDRKRIAELRDAAAAHGVSEGTAVFLEGHHPVSDEEYEEQRQRLQAGYVPDRYDLGNMIEEMNQKKNG